MYQIIDDKKEQEKYNEIVNKITPESLGLKPTSDFAQFAQKTIINDDPEFAKECASKGAIGILEAGKKYADEFSDLEDFDGNYNNVKPDYSKWQKAGQGLINSIGNKIENTIGKVYDFKKTANEGIKDISVNPYLAEFKKDNKPVLYNQTDLNSKITFLEGLENGLLSGEAMPLLGNTIKGAKIKKYRAIADKIKNGEEITQYELNIFNNYRKEQYEKAIRGYTIGGQIGESILPSLFAFGGEMALGGAALKALGLAGKGISTGVNIGKNLLKSGAVSKGTAKALAFTTGEITEGAINATATTLANLPTSLYATYQERRLNDEMKITDRGTVIFKDSVESPAKSFIKSLGQVYISYFSENMGKLIGAPVKGAAGTIANAGVKQFEKVISASPGLEKFIQKTAPRFAKAYEKLNNLPVKGKSVEWLKSQIKFDGFMEELGEEVLEDILNLTIGTNGEKRSLENYINTIKKTPEEWAVLAGVIALQGGAISIAGNALGNARKQLEEVNNWLGSSGEYTVKQQEKFARSFEAYLYKGKAPNNRLKEVFENFKEWLKSVYEHITDLVNQGADISDEVSEMFDKMFSDDEYYQEKKAADELLQKIKSISKKEKTTHVKVRDNSELDETEKRHKEVSYEIVAAGTEKSKKYLKTIFETGSDKKSFAKKREAVQMLLDKVEDKITTSGGMREEWKEFYANSGVDYNNDETGGDYKLVEAALDTIINKKYKNPDKEYDYETEARADYYEKIIDEADRQYKELLRAYKKENRNVALSAAYEWIEGLDKEIKQDYEERFIYDTKMIERDENLDKFEKAKRQIILKAMEVENKYNLSANEKYKETVKEIMKNLNFLNPEDKAKMTVNILDASSLDMLMARIDNIIDIAKTMEDINYCNSKSTGMH